MWTPFIHIGDGHFRPGPRNADRYRALDQIVDEGLRVDDLGAWWWPGDIFDDASATSDRNALDRRFRRMADKAPVIVVDGNHDKPGELEGFANLKARYPIFVVTGQPQIVRFELPRGGVWLSAYCFPYPHKQGLVGAGVARGDQSQTGEQLLDLIFPAAASKLEAARYQGDLTAVLFHANIAGAITSVGQPNIGKEIELSAVHLAQFGSIYRGGNHIHLPQELHGAWYAGSVAPKDYGEREAKRYLVVRIAPDSSYQVESRPLASLPMHHIDIGIDATSAVEWVQADDGDEDRFERNDWGGRDVRVRFHVRESERPGINFEALRARFSSAARIKFETVTIADREVRAPAVAAARTLPDKLAAMRPDGTLPASVASKVQLLEQQSDPAVVLEEVFTWLKQVEAGETEAVPA